MFARPTATTVTVGVLRSLKASRGSVDDSKRCEACVLYQCAALEKWGEDVDEN